MRGRASDLLRLPVRLNGIRVGHPQDVLLDREARRAVGLEIACGDGDVRFLPVAGVRLDGPSILVDSPFLLVDHDERSFYRGRTRSLRSLRGAEVTRGGRLLGRLDDVELGGEGDVVAFVLHDGERVGADGSVAVHVEDAAA